MASSLFPDPMQMWREALTKLENEVNSVATGSLNSQEVVRSLHEFSAASLGMQQMFEKMIGAYLRKANLPSRKEVVELAESLRRIEDKLDRLLPQQTAAAPRPARTRRPSGAEPAPSPAPVAEPVAAPKRRVVRRSKG